MARKLRQFEKDFISWAKRSPDPSEVIRSEYIFRLRANDDAATVILVGHLLTENLLDKIIQAKCKSPKIILTDSRSYPFSVKLQIVYSMDLLSEEIYKNISRVNNFRNKFAHNIEFDIDPATMMIDFQGKSTSLIDAMPLYKKKKNVSKKYLEMLCYHTLESLGKHMMIIGVDPRN